MTNSVMGTLRTQLMEEIQALQQAVCTGICKDYAEYRSLCGRINGLTSAHLRIVEMEQRVYSEMDSD